MKATSSVSASSSDKAFGLSAGAAASAGQSTGSADGGFLAMLDGLIQTAGAGSGSTNNQSQGDQAQSNLPQEEAADAIVADTSGDEAATPVLASETHDNVIFVSAVDETPALPVAAAQTVLPASSGSAAAASVSVKAATPAANTADDNTLAALAVQAGLVPVAQVQAIPQAPLATQIDTTSAVSVAAPVATTAPTSLLPVTTIAAAQGPVPSDNASTTVIPDSQTLSVPVAATIASNSQGAPVVQTQIAIANDSPAVTVKSQTASQSDQDNADTQQSAILSALFAQAPLQVLPQQQVSTADASAKPVSGVSASSANTGIASVPGVGIPPTLSPPAFVGNGSHAASAALVLASSSSDDEAAATPTVHAAEAAPSFGIGTSSATTQPDTSDDDTDEAPSPAIAGDQVKAEAIASLFIAPAKTIKADSADTSDDKTATVLAPASTDIGTTGLTLVHQSGATTSTAASTATTASAQAYTASPADQVSLTLQRATNTGPQSMTIALNPVELGKVEVKLDFAKDGSVQASVTAERPETLTMLKNDHTTLTQALHNAGLTTTSNSLSFNLRDGGQSQQQQGFTNASSHRPDTASADAEDIVSPVQTSTIQYAVANSNGRLDVTV